MLDITVDSRQLQGFSKRLERFSRIVPRLVKRQNRKKAEAFKDRIKVNASGRPGPEIQTGEYVDAFRVVENHDDTYSVENDSPQTRRLEFGFIGVDVMGRHYNQPAFPHWRTTVEQLQPDFEEMDHDVIVKGWEESK